MAFTWTQEQEGLLLRLRRKDVSQDDIADLLGCSRKAVSKKLIELGFGTAPRRTTHTDAITSDPGEPIGVSWAERDGRKNVEAASSRLAEAMNGYIAKVAKRHRISPQDATLLMHAGRLG